MTETFSDHIYGHIIWHQLAFIYKKFGVFAEFCLIFNVLAKKISGRYVCKIFRIGQYLGLGSFTNTGGTEQDDKGGHKILLSGLAVNLDNHVILVLRRCS